MMQNLRTIGFDADDTLWHNERFFKLTQQRFADLLADHAEPEQLGTALIAAERRNLGHYGFGIKGFVLSMIETAIEVTEGRVPASVIAEVIQAGREMLQHPIELLPHAQETLAAFAGSHHLVLITKGDLLDQERKLAQSGLGDMFDAVQIVSDKTVATYAEVFGRTPGGVDAAMMVGNSMKSDVRPAIEAGGWGVFVPQDLAWDFENAEAPEGAPRYREIRHLGDLPDLVAEIG
ncbi:MAG: HAD family hydrolase [Rhodobacteraceae bacterium]|nr:HAD family hydrolase [Paracoccaceae bacterium]